MPHSKGILSLMKESGFECLPCARRNIDFERLTEYDESREHQTEMPFERPAFDGNRRRIPSYPEDVPSILRYFLDGSRRTYRVSDVIVDGRYFPVVAGQVGVAIVERHHDGHVRPVKRFCGLRNVLALPERCNPSDLRSLEDTIREKGHHPFQVLSYTIKKDRDPVDLAVAKIMDMMHGLEIQALAQMTDENMLGMERMLVIDGALRFRRRFQITQFRNVLGLSKSFQASMTVGKGTKKQSIGSIAARLDRGYRSQVFRTEDQGRTLGVWYLRMRDARLMSDPLQGTVKLERYAVDNEVSDGFDGDQVDTISHFVVQERNVTPYSSDSRWASHIYPIYLAEQYIKSSFMSNMKFVGLF